MTPADRYDVGYAIGRAEGHAAGYGEGYAEASDRVRADLLRVIEAHLNNSFADPVTRIQRTLQWVSRERITHSQFVRDVLTDG